jgi:hypothetical protein
MCLGGGSKKVKQEVSYPKYVERGGRETYEAGRELAQRPYETYQGARIAPFSPDQALAFMLARQNVGSWMPGFQAGWGQTWSGTSPVGQEDIDRYFNPYQKYVDDFVYQQAQRQKLQENAAWSKRGSYMNEDRRAAIDALRDERSNEAVGRLRAAAYDRALGQANIERNRDLAAANQFYQAALQRQRQGMGDVGMMSEIGQQQQDWAQQNLDLRYQDFLRQFGYPQEQISWLASLLGNTPYGQTTTSPVGSANPVGQGVGMAALLGSLFGSGGTASIPAAFLGGGLGLLGGLL